MKKNNSGFSLVELIIVIAIMAVLIGVLAPQFIKYVERSRESTDLQNIEEVKTAAEAFVADKGLSKSDKITISFTSSSCTITLPTGYTDLEEYGVDATKLKLKGKWNPATITWEYENYVWKNSAAATGAAFESDGSPIS